MALNLDWVNNWFNFGVTSVHSLCENYECILIVLPEGWGHIPVHIEL